MSDQTHAAGAVTVLALSEDGPLIDTDRDASDALAAGWSARADMVAIPLARLPADFLRLSSGRAGALLQKFANYRMRVAIVGDISGALTASGPLRDFVRESNRGIIVWFADDLAALLARLF